MAAQSPTTRLSLPTTNYIGARGANTIKAIADGTFQTADDRLMQAGSGQPNGAFTSHWAGQRYLDTNSGKLWFNALVDDLTNWKQLQGGELLSHNNVSVFVDNEAVTL